MPGCYAPCSPRSCLRLGRQQHASEPHLLASSPQSTNAVRSSDLQPESDPTNLTHSQLISLDKDSSAQTIYTEDGQDPLTVVYRQCTISAWLPRLRFRLLLISSASTA